jgi:radical SAM protein with 4Fe4S-binding SPASM domain
MTTPLHELENQLKSQFNVKAMCDIGTMTTSPNVLFKLLHSVYQNSYSPTDRIVFYTSHLLPDNFLKHFYETVNFIDISNCFILICGPAGLEDAVKSCCKKFSQDPCPFQFQTIDLEITQQIDQQFFLPDTICAIPWTNLEIRSDGSFSPCCMTNGEQKLGNIKNTTLEQAFHSKDMQELRRDLLAGERPASCQPCWKVEEKNLSSIRTHNIKRLKKDFLLKYLDQPQLATIDIKFNNTCNFKCRICGPESSSLFAQEQNKFRGTSLVVQNNWSESDDFVDQMSMHLPTIHNIDMYGGEPFLVKKFKKVLKLAVDNDHAKNIRLHYNSNGSVWPDQFLPYWPSFKEIDIHFSIDAIGRQFELQRGGNWSSVESNILRLKDLKLPNLTISVMPTIGVMNVYYIDQVYDWATKHGFSLFVSHARGVGFELGDLTRTAKDLIIEKFKDHPWDELQRIVKIIQELPDSNGEQFRSKIKWFDQIREENFADSHYEIANAMEYVYNKNI